MSSSLMSCVRENSPPIKFDLGPKERSKASNSNTLPTPSSKQKLSSKTNPMAETQDVPHNEQHKKRRFHPLRNLRRIFRRRTITSATDTENSIFSPSASSSEKNLRSATLSSISKTASASSPSSPLTHQQLNDAYLTKSLPKSKSYATTISDKKKDAIKSETNSSKKTNKHHITNSENSSDMYTSAGYQSSSISHQRQSMGIAVLPTSKNLNLFTERQVLNSMGDSSQDLDSTGNDSFNNTNSSHRNFTNGTSHCTNESTTGGDISDSTRSLSEGRLIDSDYGREGLSQSHDSVFSESATASSISIVLKAELADVLRKRRNRPDTSEEDLGLPSSPTSPQKPNDKFPSKAKSKINTSDNSKLNNQSDLSSGILRRGSGPRDQSPATSTPNKNFAEDEVQTRTTPKRYTRAATISTDVIWQGLESNDLVDYVHDERLHLSHAAAKHKMAIRPTKKKMPSRLQRRTLDIATSIPENTEEFRNETEKVSMKNKKIDDAPGNTKSLPLHVTSKNILDDSSSKKTANIISAPVNTSRLNEVKSPQEKVSPPESPSKTKHFEAFANKKTFVASKKEQVTSVKIVGSKESEAKDVAKVCDMTKPTAARSFKRTISTSKVDEEHDLHLNEPKKLLLSGLDMEGKMKIDKSLPAIGKSPGENKSSVAPSSGLTSLLSSYNLSSKIEKAATSAKETIVKYRSGPAARQRFLPKELDYESSSSGFSSSPKKSESDIAKMNSNFETFESTSLIKDITKTKSPSSSTSLNSLKSDRHYEKKAKIIGLSAFQQKITRSSECFDYARSSNSSMETSTDGPLDYYEEKQRSAVEKSRSFRTLHEPENTNLFKKNIPSLPDLSLSIRIPSAFLGEETFYKDDDSLPNEAEEKCVSLGFEINDNNLLKCKSDQSVGPSLEQDKNIILTTSTVPGQPVLSKFLSPNSRVIPNITTSEDADKEISEIEENIDKIMKAPLVSVLRSTSDKKNDLLSSSSAKKSTTLSGLRPERPTTLHFDDKINGAFKEKALERTPDKVKTKSLEKNDLISPTLAAVPLREKSKIKEIERSSVPASQGINAEYKGSSRRCSSLIAPNDNDSNVPEFMKIQLNRVDPEKIIRTNVVLAKNNASDFSSFSNSKSPDSSFPHLRNKRGSSGTLDNIEINEASLQAKDKIPNSPTKVPTYSKTNENAIILTNSPLKEKLGSPTKLSNQAKLNEVSVTPINATPGTNLSCKEKLNSPLKSSREPVTILAKSSPRENEFSSSKVASQNRSNEVSTTPLSTSPLKEKLAASPFKVSNQAKTNEKASLLENSPLKEKLTSPVKMPTQNNLILSSNKKGPENHLVEVMTPMETSYRRSSFEKPQHLNGSSEKEVVVSDAKLSLQERKRLFLAAEAKNEIKTPEFLRSDRKKSLNEELFRKSYKANNSSNDSSPSTSQSKSPILSLASSPTNHNDTLTNPIDQVILRKKSLVSSGTNSFNGNVRLSSAEKDRNDNDSTPELMKVFARRSLKIKDEDVQALTNKVNEAINSGAQNAGPSSIRKLSGVNSQLSHPNIDSDKENQSASDEKLDKIPFEPTSTSTTASNNRNSVADFRSSLGKFSSKNQNHVISASSAIPTSKLPQSFSSTKINNFSSISKGSPERPKSAFQASTTTTEANNNLRSLHNSPLKSEDKNKKPMNAPSESSNSHQTPSTKTIERSQTISEFKAIHQRRAEWEQRAKESFK